MNSNDNSAVNVSFQSFLDKLRCALISNLKVYHQYNISNKEYKNKEEVISNMAELKKINSVYLSRIKKQITDLEDSQNEVVHQIAQELKAKRRIQFSALFYFSFYLLGGTIVSNAYRHSLPLRLGLMAFLFVPNIIFYQKKFEKSNMKMEEILLNHSLGKIVIVKDQEMLGNFIKDYLNFCIKNKLT